MAGAKTATRGSPAADGAGGKASNGGRHRRPPRATGPVVTDRDLAILHWVGKHGVVTRDQVANHFFARDNGKRGIWAAYRRVRILVEMELLREDRTFWRQANVLRLTQKGARFAEVDMRPAKLVLADLKHTLAVVDLLDGLLAKLPKNTVLLTEREIRTGRRRDMRHGGNSSGTGTGRIPDAELQVRGKRVAVELDLTPKRSRVYEDILLSYMDQQYDEVWWYVSPRVVPRLKQIVADNQADDFVTVRPRED